MKVGEIKEMKMPNTTEIRYQIVLNTEVMGNVLAWKIKVSAWSVDQAVIRAREIFEKQRGAMQEAIMQKWNVHEVTPLQQVKSKKKSK